MSNTRLMLILILVQQSMMGVIWLGAALLGLARASAWHRGLSALLVATSLALVTLRQANVSPWLAIGRCQCPGRRPQVLAPRRAALVRAPWE